MKIFWTAILALALDLHWIQIRSLVMNENTNGVGIYVVKAIFRMSY
jgi:hypothetical protein